MNNNNFTFYKIEELSQKFSPFLRIMLFFVAALPLAISYKKLTPSWDELLFLHKAACINNGVFSRSIIAIDACFAELTKSPLMTLLLLPAGPLTGGDPAILGTASVTLALATFSLAVALGWVTTKLNLRLWAIAIAAFSILSTPSITSAPAPLLADGIFAFVVSLTLLFPLVEVSKTNLKPFYIGTFYGLVFVIGVSTKFTYLFFAGFSYPLVGFLSLKHAGLKATGTKMAGFILAALPAFALFYLYGHLYFEHAQNFSFGKLAEYYSDGVSRSAYLQKQVSTAPLSIFSFLVLGGVALWRRRQDPIRVTVGLVIAGIILLFDIVAAGSPNKDPRFFWPVWIALPICLAAAIPNEQHREPKTMALSINWATIIAVFLALPMYSHMDLNPLRKGLRALEIADAKGAKSIGVLGDTAALNIETFLLAQKLDHAKFGNMKIFTTTYDTLRGNDIAESRNRLLDADVVAVFPPDGSAPEWATERFERLFIALSLNGRRRLAPPGIEPIWLSFRGSR